jgi:hypothetical protein
MLSDRTQFLIALVIVLGAVLATIWASDPTLLGRKGVRPKTELELAMEKAPNMECLLLYKRAIDYADAYLLPNPRGISGFPDVSVAIAELQVWLRIMPQLREALVNCQCDEDVRRRLIAETDRQVRDLSTKLSNLLSGTSMEYLWMASQAESLILRQRALPQFVVQSRAVPEGPPGVFTDTGIKDGIVPAFPSTAIVILTKKCSGVVRGNGPEAGTEKNCQFRTLGGQEFSEDNPEDPFEERPGVEYKVYWSQTPTPRVGGWMWSFHADPVSPIIPISPSTVMATLIGNCSGLLAGDDGSEDRTEKTCHFKSTSGEEFTVAFPKDAFEEEPGAVYKLCWQQVHTKFGGLVWSARAEIISPN